MELVDICFLLLEKLLTHTMLEQKGFSFATSREPTQFAYPRSLTRLFYGCAGWPGSILVVKTNHFWFQQEKGLKSLLIFINNEQFQLLKIIVR